MATIVCGNCKAELSEYKRFCPECGARLPEPEAPAASPVAPTLILPPSDAPAAPPPRPADVSPTVRLDTPQEATIIAPPSGGPPAPPAAPVSDLPPVSALPPVINATPAGSLPLPPSDIPVAAPPARGRGPTFWWLIGGAGCLSLVLVGACIFGLITFLGNSIPDPDGGPAAFATASSGGGGIVPDDSVLAGGTVLLEDDFDSAAASGLGEDEDETSRYAYEGGAYVVEVKEPQTLVWARFDGSYSDARFAVDAEVPPGADVAAAGLLFHYQDADNFYLFSVSNDGYYALELLEGNEWVTLIDWTQSDAVDAVRNRIEVATQGDQIALYVNGELLEETSDGAFTDGEVGIAVSSLEDSTAEIHFDNMVISENE
jgi:hypothetical protein